MNENPLQGSFIIDELTDLVEEAVLAGVRQASRSAAACSARWSTGYQRGKIQDESLLYEHRKHDGSLPIVGVNTFVREPGRRGSVRHARAGPRHGGREAEPARPPCRLPVPAPGEAETTIRRLQDVATGDGNVFDELMNAARVCSLGQLTDAFFEVGGQYRRNM